MEDLQSSLTGNELKEKESLQTNDELRGKLGEIIAYLMTIQDKQ